MKQLIAMAVMMLGLSACAAPFAVQAGMGVIGATMTAAGIGEAICADAADPEACKGNTR